MAVASLGSLPAHGSPRTTKRVTFSSTSTNTLPNTTTSALQPLNQQTSIINPDLVEFTYIWPVNVSMLEHANFKDVVASPDFATCFRSISYQWQLLLYPTESTSAQRESTIGYYLTYRDGPLAYVAVDCELFILSPKKETISSNIAKAVELEVNGRPWGYATFCMQDITALEYHYSTQLVEDQEVKFGIRLRLHHKYFVPRNFFQEQVPLEAEPLSAYLFDRVVMEPETGADRADCRLVAMDGSGFYCNRAVLEFASPIFQQQLAKPCVHPFTLKEVPGDSLRFQEIKIDDLGASALKEVLHYIYKGIPSAYMPAIASEVVHGADKYQLAELKTLCEKEMVLQLTDKNAIKYVYIAICYGLPVLKNMALNVVYDRWAVIKATKAADKMLEDKRIMQKLLDSGSMRINCHLNYVSWDARPTNVQ